MALCSVEGCDRTVRERGWCPTHYWRWWKFGDPLREPVPKIHPTCAVDGCDALTKGHGYCSRHWQKWKKYGDPLADHRPVAETECSIAGCRKGPVRGRGWCAMHYQRWRTHGDPSVRIPNGRPWREDVTYTAVHRRLKSVLPQLCAVADDTCKGRVESAFRHDAAPSKHRRYDTAMRRWYSVRVEDYVPLCRSHHIRYDRGVGNARFDIEALLTAAPSPSS